MISENITTSCTVTREEISELQKILGNKILLEGDSEYDIARKVWNGMIDRRPAVIIQCHSSDDVLQAMKFAKNYNLIVSVKGGGHNIAGNSVCEGGVMIDLSKMKEIIVDPEKRTAVAGAGVLWSNPGVFIGYNRRNCFRHRYCGAYPWRRPGMAHG